METEQLDGIRVSTIACILGIVLSVVEFLLVMPGTPFKDAALVLAPFIFAASFSIGALAQPRIANWLLGLGSAVLLTSSVVYFGAMLWLQLWPVIVYLYGAWSGRYVPPQRDRGG